MLNLPLSSLSDDLLAYIVEHVSKFPFQNKHLHNLSLADRAFTNFCQKYLFRTFRLSSNSGSKRSASKELEKKRKILMDKPSFANWVRKVQLHISHKQEPWLLNQSALIELFQLFAKSPMPPHELHFCGPAFFPLTISDPILVVGRLSQSFFSQSLTILHLTECKNIPLPLFFVFPGLREMLLDHVGATDKTYDEYPDKHCFGQGPLALQHFNYRDSQSLVKQMLTPPPRFGTPLLLWSKLRVLRLSPHEKEEMGCLQPILDGACDSLEELYLTNLHVGNSEQVPLAKLVNLGRLVRLRVFALYAIIECQPKGFATIHDINIVLGTLPASNAVTNFSFELEINGKRPFGGCLEQDWVGMCDEVMRISAGKPLELEMMLTVSTGELVSQHPGEDELYIHIMERIASLSAFPKICTHVWNPTCWTRGLGPFPRGQVRSPCRK
ncbi:hypothetical protein GALMADRAFT_128730 [Galerina marginata CBS 339.88]|uniref:F-box domain-containing protein n=1 Tax=Galerina marginata (strain CBS 339.88) TaxID=685588 RepID=A0A067SE99_GALM3|nr:hypothetical protein GALMADRAFT_128730 [Galerina marginata CBS 339.88]